MNHQSVLSADCTTQHGAIGKARVGLPSRGTHEDGRSDTPDPTGVTLGAVVDGGLLDVRRVVVILGSVAMAGFTCLTWASVHFHLSSSGPSGSLGILPDSFSLGFPLHLWDLDGGWLLVPIVVVVACALCILATLASAVRRAPSYGMAAAGVVLIAEGILFIRLWGSGPSSYSDTIPVGHGATASFSAQLSLDVGAWLTLAVVVALLLFPLLVGFIPWGEPGTPEGYFAPDPWAGHAGAPVSGPPRSVAPSAPAAVRAPEPSAATAPAGWYVDPTDPSMHRYFDGTSWTSRQAPRYNST
jgi:hypothetical protein